MFLKLSYEIVVYKIKIFIPHFLPCIEINFFVQTFVKKLFPFSKILNKIDFSQYRNALCIKPIVLKHCKHVRKFSAPRKCPLRLFIKKNALGPTSCKKLVRPENAKRVLYSIHTILYTPELNVHVPTKMARCVNWFFSHKYFHLTRRYNIMDFY